MNISNEETLISLIDMWKDKSPYLQEKNLRIAEDTIDLNMMYYEQKENVKGVLRMERCLKILEKYRGEVDLIKK